MTFAESVWVVFDTQVQVPEIEEYHENRIAAPGDVPRRLSIPALGIDANVQEVGVTAAGNMATPNNFVDVGWYKYGTLPGLRGSAVVAGHVDNGLGLSGVFKNLSDLQIGDDVFVVNENGDELLFRVVEIQKYPYTLVPGEVLFSRSDSERLNLITCEGAWLHGERTYDQRLVVYTELVTY